MFFALFQAHSLVWMELSAEQIGELRSVKAAGQRELLAKFLRLGEHAHSPKSAINLDLYAHTLQFGLVRACMWHVVCTTQERGKT